MVQTKKMNESFFAKLLKEFDVAGELVRSRQDEKQGLLDEFDAESKRFFFGKISERALSASVRKTNKELSRLDGEIRANIAKGRNAGDRAMTLTSAQAPVRYRATLSGIVGGGLKTKKKRKAKRKAVKKKVKKKTVKRKAKKTKAKRATVKKKTVKRKAKKRKVVKKKSRRKKR